MREMKHAPHGSKPTGDSQAGRGPGPDDPAEGINAFLIADIRGYTLFTQERGDEAAAALTSRFGDIVRSLVDKRDGSLIELPGDEALATFRSPRQAIRAAVDLQARLLEETRSTPDLPLPVGIGLEVGEAASVGGGYRGGALNLAARLCGEAGPGEILASQNLVHLAGAVDGVRYLDHGELHLKGLSDSVHVVQLASEELDVAEQMKALVPTRRRQRVFGGKMHFRVLGTLEVDGRGGPIPLGGPRQRAVLAHLLIRANELVPAETLVDEIWGDAPPETARNTIQTYVSRLRIALGHDRIRTHAPGYSLRVDAFELDAVRFDSLMRDAKKALPVDPAIAVSTLDDALALWRGPALADLADHSSLLAEAARLDELRLEAQEARIEGLLASGAEARAIGELEVLVARNPLRESLWGLLMLALYREGRQADALNTYQRLREILADELGIDPSPELARLHERVLRQDPGLDLRGEPLRGYRLLEKIHDGPVGVVFRAIQPHVGRDVAVKVLPERVASDPEFVIRFEREAQAAASLEHPHIAPIYDYWREPGRAYVVSRYFGGGSLRALEERGESLEAERALRVVEQIASALAFAHRQDVSHGNVRSSNVLFDAEGNAYLGDFRIGVGPDADPADDIRDLAGLIRKVLPRNTALASLAEHAEVGGDLAEAGAIAEAARTALDPLRVAAPRRVDERNPYKGLRAFIEADAGDFFGRGELSHRLMARLNEAGRGSRFLAVVGPSGCGKSSVVRAGLIPAIRQGALVSSESTFIAEMFPGAQPIEELEAALLRIAVRPPSRFHDLLESSSRGLLEVIDLIAPGESEVVLVVDQFEEVFTLTQDERQRKIFLESLRVATADPESRLHVIITLRADFYDRPLVYPRFGELLAARTEAVLPLTPDELEQAIREPAEQVGVRPEPGLVAEMIADVANQPGALPLLQYALTELFERRDGRNLTLPVYREIGGVAGALSARADRIYEATDPVGRRAIKQVFLRLITLGEGRQDTRRLVTRSELDSLEVDQEAIGGVLGAYGRHRLLTFDREPSTREPTVEIAHEALLGTWQRLRIWIDDAREDLRQNQQLAHAAAEWRGSAQDPSFLLRGTRLEQLEAWLATSDLVVGQPERAYLKASIDRREGDRAREESRHTEQRRLERRARRRLVGLVAAIAMLVAAATYGALLWLGNRPPDVALLIEPEGTYQGLFAQGIDRAISELGLDAEKVPTLPELMDQELRRLSEEGVDLILVQSNLVDVNAVAADFPDTRYVAFDFTGQTGASLPNVSYVSFAVNEGSFLVGAAAALESRTGRIGFIGGVDIAVIREFQTGYEAGARAVDPSIDVRSTYLTPAFDFSGFGSPTLGLQAAERLYRHGADVIYHAAGDSGWGVFRAAAEIRGRHVWAIGVDVDQYQEIAAMDPKDAPPELHIALWPSHVLTSMIKRVDVAVYAVLRDYSRGIFTSGVRDLGLAEDSVDIAYSGGFIDDMRPQIEDLRAKIIAGDVVVPTKPGEA
jgi:basic membrane lipoprotein Med (substrate-binding protein (PBP1-ABC) superfamily)/DNA-binding SARP family transcriptional activator/class 3 adenylate cyclase